MVRIGAIALIRKDAHFPQVLRHDKPRQTRTEGMFIMSSRVLPAASGVFL